MIGRIEIFDTDGLRSKALEAWRWWTGELAGMLPQRLRAILAAHRRPIVVDIRDDAIVISGATAADLHLPIALQGVDLADSAVRSQVAAAAQSVRRDAPVHLRLPPQHVLRRTIDLPRAAARTLHDILRLEVERLSPVGIADVAWGWTVIERTPSQGKIRIGVWLVKKGVMAHAARLCEALALMPTMIGVVGDPVAIPARGLLPHHEEPVVRRLYRHAVPALVVLAMAAASLLLLVETVRQQNEIDQLLTRVDTAKAGAQAADRLRKDIQHAAARVDFLANRKRDPLAIAILTEVTRQLPDDCWLLQFQLGEREIRIQGFAPKAATLIEVFSRSALFANPQFRAPVTRGPRGDMERFDLSFELRGRR